MGYGNGRRGGRVEGGKSECAESEAGGQGSDSKVATVTKACAPEVRLKKALKGLSDQGVLEPEKTKKYVYLKLLSTQYDYVMPPWPNGQGVRLRIGRLWVRLPLGVEFYFIFLKSFEEKRWGVIRKKNRAPPNGRGRRPTRDPAPERAGGAGKPSNIPSGFSGST